MPYPKSQARAAKADPNTAHVADELAAMKAAAAAHNFTNNPGPETYVEHAKLTEAKVASQTSKDRGPKHTRA